jgi:putative endonuclease
LNKAAPVKEGGFVIMASFFVYILQSQTTGHIYIGQTSDLKRRLQEHNNPDFKGTLHTKRRKGPWNIIYSEIFDTRSQAMKKEIYLKSGMGRKWIKENILSKQGGC